MKKKISLLLPACWLLAVSAWGQTNFRAGWQKANPVAPESTLAFEEKVKTHQAFLDKATHDNDALKRLYGFLYLFYDHLKASDYSEAAHCLLEAEGIAKASGDPGWQGWVSHRKGILSVHLKNFKEAIPPYETSATLCGVAGDSLCLAESLEQISAMYGRLDDFEEAHRYFSLAMPLLEQYGGDVQVCVALNNFGNLLAMQERPAEAIPYLERALTLGGKTGDQRRAVLFLNNLADPYCQLHRYDRALEIYRRCIQINREHNWPENLVFNYVGISEVYKQMGDFRAALDFFQQYHDLRDSLIGAKTQEKIADLEAKYHSQQKELELQKSQAALGAAQRTLERGVWLIFSLLLLAGFGLWRWRSQIRHAKRALAQNQEVLTDLTRILLEKNTLLTALEEQASEQLQHRGTSPAPADFEENFYSQRILTDADWTAFKAYFEKAYPGYLQRLRSAFPALSEAEERLSLFIKLNLNTKETAAILGISADSVKKTRNRLRKRMELGEEINLEGFIRAF